MDKKYYCGMYKGYKIYQVGERIGNNFYGYFYASQLCNKNYIKDKQSEKDTWEDLKEYINSRLK